MTLFLMITVFAVVVINIFTLWGSWQHNQKVREDDARNLSVSLAKQAEDAFLQVDITLADAVRQLSLNGLEYASTPVFAYQLKEQQGKLRQLHGLFIYDAQGRWLATSGNYAPAKGSNADRDYFVWHRTHDDSRVRIGRVIRSRSTGDLVIPVSLRLNDATGNFAGVALATVKVDYFRQFYSYYTLGERDVLGLILADTSVLYIRPFPDTAINKSLSSSPLFTTVLKTSSSGSATWRSALDGVERVYGYARLEQYPLIVTAGYDLDKIHEDWFAANIIDVLLNLILLVMISGMGMVVLRQVKKNVKNQLELTQIRDELTTINHTLQSLALIDGLTGLANRRQFDAMLDQILKRSQKSGEPVSLIMIDIDFFKRYNDTYGHVAGDSCLQRVSTILKEMTQRQDAVVARYGGEEFAIILPFTGKNDAKKVAERAVNAVLAARIPHESSGLPEHVVTLSAGYSSLISDGHPDEAQRLRQQADKALYEAKNKGRNRVHVLI
ncbi:sensor domain-containing diguanylate cyclase [Pantoea sp. Bo_2]|uniref:diguanylate cyclase n=1 Tax=Candidatus Pantoea gossypiicola TaxID=2608008 RepID=A0AB34CRL4_9GAMM|nr:MULTISPECIES: sensor domain-containing diguanylate cyclase [Pantoea]KAA5932999.1 sensor domain-containing diguanylate cyclase [Pantoea sp. VH_8]KAA5937786.1 sensor domain-containing diguanylate cyclase [Pantoea sp. VH_4]KAA5950428.1 sensor domain-containing diguanylate cyclase [Pantoea sp. VH_3]KAA5955800.1 sensor domain-containing diguanylate cyclase [Pantoea sp. VH_25]KAA5960036.1 sensor domain-containing diguanylate cyclase [Pantoea sp. VH_24]